jgi:hypothetical protein
LGLAFVEVKYGDGAMTGSADLVKHFEDVYKFISKNGTKGIGREVETIIKQKNQLGLFAKYFPRNNKNDYFDGVKINYSQKPEFILLLANHKPSSTKLKTQLKNIVSSPSYQKLIKICDVKIATSSFMGYGLFDELVVPLETFT